MKSIHPYLRFNDGKCREAMDFYKSALGGTVTLQTVGESPMADEMKAGKDKIMHAVFKKGNAELFYGSDMMRDKAVVGDNISVTVNCDSEKELRDMYNKLSAGGEDFMKPDKVPWGAIFGVCTDKYGVEWMLNFQQEEMGTQSKKKKK